MDTFIAVAVSYTHLRTCGVTSRIRNQSGFLNLLTVDPVSYTHLDVYKRQENTFDGKIQQKNNIFQSSKRSGNGIGIESVRHIIDKNGGACDFTYKDGIFSAKIMLRI